MQLLDTIAAISTPHGKGGVALVRISGARALSVASRVFRPKSGRPLESYPARQAVYGSILAPDGEEWVAVDDGIATVFAAPSSFTGEETVELCCHGGILLTQTVLSGVLAAGARAAEAGEFTRRAFLNGKMDLSAAEALGSLLEAGNRQQLSLAYGGLGGRLSEQIRSCYESLLDVMTSVQACIDFPDEDLSQMSREDMQGALESTACRLRDLAASYRTGHAIAEGIPTVICGRTNAGKSTLYNALLGREAAIVTDVEGTTRDVLSETTVLGGVTLRLSDTAGLRSTEDAVERIGIDRTYRAMQEAELILATFDRTRPLSCEEIALLEQLAAREREGTPVIALLNKADRDERCEQTERTLLQTLSRTVTLSAQTGQGLDELARVVEELFLDGSIDLRNDAVVANARQHAAVAAALAALDQALEALSGGLPVDVCCLDIREAMRALSELDGRAIDEQIVAAIFSRFCVGK